jgi:hypothetical protein
MTPEPEEPSFEALSEEIAESLKELNEEFDDVFSNAVFGPAVLLEKDDPASPTNLLLREWRKNAIAALDALLQADLFSTVGVEKARGLQNEAKRYFDMATLLNQAVIDMKVAGKARRKKR